MFFSFPRRYKAGYIFILFFLLCIDHKESFSDLADSLPTSLAGRVFFAPVKPPYPQRISEHILSYLKTNFMLSLVVSVLGLILNEPAFFHKKL